MTIAPPDVTGQRRIYGPRFAVGVDAKPAPPNPDLTIVAQPWGPTILPDQITTISPGQVGYQDLFSSLGPDGQPARGQYRGTFPPVVGTMPRGW